MWGVPSQQQQQQQSQRQPLRMQAPEAATGEDAKLSPKQERRRIIASPNFHRQIGFSKGEKEGVESQMVSEFTSQLINEMKDRTFTYQKGDLTIKLAKSFGFCWGVERAVAMAYEAAAHFPDRVRACGRLRLVCVLMRSSMGMEGCEVPTWPVRRRLGAPDLHDIRQRYRKSTSRTRSSTTRA